jgi:hypothetical protein
MRLQLCCIIFRNLGKIRKVITKRIVLLDFIHRLVSQEQTSVQWLGHLLPPVFDWLQGFMCVCT